MIVDPTGTALCDRRWLLLVDQFYSLICESLAKVHCSILGEMDVTVGMVWIAAIEVIGIDPGVAAGLAQLDLRLPDACASARCRACSGRSR